MSSGFRAEPPPPTPFQKRPGSKPGRFYYFISMRLFFAILLGISCLFLGCAYHPPIDEIPQYGFPENSMEEIQADSIYQEEFKTTIASN